MGRIEAIRAKIEDLQGDIDYKGADWSEYLKAARASLGINMSLLAIAEAALAECAGELAITPLQLACRTFEETPTNGD